MDSLGLIHLFLNVKGFDAPKSQKEISRLGQSVNIYELKAGDIILFGKTDHLGIYEGEGNFIHANENEVARDHLSKWEMSFIDARRL